MTIIKSRRDFIKTMGFSVAVSAIPGSLFSKERFLSGDPSKRKNNGRNIVVILCDQLRPDFLPMYGCDAIKTPNLDRLQSMGTVFKHAITASTVCGPARASMMTGTYLSNHGVWANDIPFRDGMDYMPMRMNEMGYQTAAFGKLHHKPALDLKGFQHASLMEEGRLKEKEPYLKWLQQKYPNAKSVFNFDRKNLVFDYEEEDYYEHWIASETIDWLSHHRRADQPFMAWVSFQGPHTPYDPPKEVKGCVDADKLPKRIKGLDEENQVLKYRGVYYKPPMEEMDKIRVAYAEMIVAIDKQIGRILNHLDEHGLTDNTTFIFSSDHGDLLGDHGLNTKGPYPYQGQLGVPLLIANHPKVQSGAQSNSLTGNIDIPGTVLDIAGADHSIGLSRSLVDLAQETPKHPRKVNFSEYCDSVKTVEDEKYRYCYYPLLGYGHLFDKQNDPKELKNLSGMPEYSEIEQKFLKNLIDFRIAATDVHIEGKDLVPGVQDELKQFNPEFIREMKLAGPLYDDMRKKLKLNGLKYDYNEAFKGRKILNPYKHMTSDIYTTTKLD
ncbi:sulfatase [Puteibacter caeruleilacunae]|nr:sulfatase [Puteibacter caeruleilacunae]